LSIHRNEFEIFEILKKIEIKNPKKTSVYFKIFGQTRIKKFEIFCPKKFMTRLKAVKIQKKQMAAGVTEARSSSTAVQVTSVSNVLL
jgi:hypothetical protein